MPGFRSIFLFLIAVFEIFRYKEAKTLFSCMITILDHTLYGKVKNKSRYQGKKKILIFKKSFKIFLNFDTYYVKCSQRKVLTFLNVIYIKGLLILFCIKYLPSRFLGWLHCIRIILLDQRNFMLSLTLFIN